MSLNKYISVFRSLNAAGTISVQLSSVDLASPVSLTATTESLANTLAPDEIAQAIYTALKTKIEEEERTYTGQPVYGDETAPFTFRVLIADHVVTIWSQANFRLKVTAGNGSIVLGDNTPCFMTLDQMNSALRVMGRCLNLTDADKGQAGLIASAELIAGMNGNYIVPSVYLEAQPGFDTRGTVLPHDSIIFVDPEISRSATMAGFTGIFRNIGGVISDFDSRSGSVHYPDRDRSYEPYQRGQQIRRTYVAGYLSIPAIVKRSASEFSSMATIPKEIASVKGGSGQVVLRGDTNALQKVLFNVREYIL